MFTNQKMILSGMDEEIEPFQNFIITKTAPLLKLFSAALS
jgi:hypothetical protein